jgi:hypothetical protein
MFVTEFHSSVYEIITMLIAYSFLCIKGIWVIKSSGLDTLRVAFALMFINKKSYPVLVEGRARLIICLATKCTN